MTEINETVMSASIVITALSKFDDSIYESIIKDISTLSNFDDSTYDAIIRNITEKRAEQAERNAEELREYNALKEKFKEVEKKLKATGLLNADSDNSRKYNQIANPNNPAEVYRTGKYPDWLKEMAQSEGVDISNKSAMAAWVKGKGNSSH